MTTVRAQCPACGDVKLGINDLTVRVCVDDSSPSAYRFQCPICDETVHRTASARIVDLLVSAGASHGPPVDFLVNIANESWFDELVALVRRTAPG